MGISWNLDYPSRRAPILARNVVATSQPLATQAGLNAFRKGGNAVDAAVAAAITLTVVEPCSNGVGSDAFAIVHDSGRLYGLNAAGKSPAAWTPDHFRKYDSMPQRGWDAATVPGAVSAWQSLTERFGELAFEDHFEDAIRYAAEGFNVGHETSRHWATAKTRLGDVSGFADHFLPQGRAPTTGELFKRPDLVPTLASIAESNGDAFYIGDVAKKIVDQAQREGGAFSLADFENHQAIWCEPIATRYNDVTLHEIPPSGQGLAAQIALALLEHTPSRSLKPNSAEWVHWQVEAMKIAIQAAFDHISDPSTMTVSIDELLEPESIQRAAQELSESATIPPPIELPTSSDTVYLSAADKDGQMISLIQSNYQGFGSGVVVKGTGIALQNRGAGFTLEVGHPNQVDGGKYPFHTIIPGFVTDSAGARLSFGVMGGHMQAQGHVQMVTRIFDHGENPQAASDAPRWYVTPDYTIKLESGFNEEIAEDLDRRGHDVEIEADYALFGGAQLIYRQSDGTYIAASDHRKEGQAAGY